MSLDSYRHRRDFNRSPEPAGSVRPTPTGRLYIIQKHAARRLHYDLRLELDGVLKSWAVPRGPSLDPGKKRLAVQVEDHPIEYGDFEGIIPPGQYGGGTVLLWDRGEWEPIGDPHEGLRRGVFKFLLNGNKLRGAWALIRLKPKETEMEAKNWILIKERDPVARSEGEITEHNPRSVVSGKSMEEISREAGRVWLTESNSGPGLHSGEVEIDPSKIPQSTKAAFPSHISPQSATLVSQVPREGPWLHEIKYDGFRIICYVHARSVRLMTRNDKDWSARFDAIRKALEALPLSDAVIDGEVVVMSREGRTDFQALQNVIKGITGGTIVYIVFDLLYYAGYDLTRSPLSHRKQLLSRLISAYAPENPTLRYSEHIEERGEIVFTQACRLGLEGIVSKRSDSPYEGRRTRSWVKAKCIRRQEFVIGGFSEPAGGRIGFGALLLGYYDGDELIYCGRVGTGFSEETIRRLFPLLRQRERKSPPFVNTPQGREARGVHWVAPELIAEVAFSEITREGLLRHPSYKGLREDKEPRQVALEVALPRPESNHSPRKKSGGAMSVAGIPLSNPDRILYPEMGITKQELAEYYEKISEYILPHIVHRPLTLVRCPEGPRKGCFYQKHLRDTLPESVKGIDITEKHGSSTYISIVDLRGLIGVVQLAALELHPWGSTEAALESPDRLIFDLDPGEGVRWADLVHAARLIRENLHRYGLESFLKTTGGKGLHVVVPVVPDATWDEARAFTRMVAMEIAQSQPDRFTATMAKKKRVGKIFIDYVRNSRGATAIAPYSTRARENCPIAVPIAWEELNSGIRPDSVTIRTIDQRLKRMKNDPWEGFFSTRQEIASPARG